jgi:hypothetical protein
MLKQTDSLLKRSPEFFYGGFENQMTLRAYLLVGFLLACAAFLPGAAWANISNTGAGLGALAIDPNWVVIQAPVPIPNTGAPAYVVDPLYFPLQTGNWWPDTSPLALGSSNDSKWISADFWTDPNAPSGVRQGGNPVANAPTGVYSQPEGTYEYQMTFTGATTLEGLWGTDNPGVGVFLDGVQVAQTSGLPGDTGFTGPTFTPFTVTATTGGTHTLGFMVKNDLQDIGNPTGIRVEFTPEPGFYGLLALGLSGLGVFVRRRVRP